MKQKILCTGSCGFVVGNLVRKILHDNKYDVVSLDRINTSSMMNNIVVHKSHQFYMADITDSHIINKIFEFERPDFVIHGAEEQAENLIKTNVYGTSVIVDAAIKNDVKKLVYLSSDKIYGGIKENDLLHSENDKINPMNAYAASKVAGELFVQSSNINYNIIRSCNNYGPRQTSNKLIPKTVKSIFENKDIDIYGNGLQLRDWIHVFDNSSAVMKILENGNDKIYNVSSNQEFSNMEVVQMICNSLERGHNLIRHIENIRKDYDFRYGCSNSKLKSLGWEPIFKFKTGITAAVDWYFKNRWLIK